MKLESIEKFIEEVEDYVLESNNYERGFELIVKRKDFGKKPLELGMFVPCDEDGNVLEFKGNIRFSIEDWGSRECFEQYLAAEERVLFKGFDYNQDGLIYDNQDFGLWKDEDNMYYLDAFDLQIYKVEQLINVWGKGITLTESAIKQIGYKQS